MLWQLLRASEICFAATSCGMSLFNWFSGGSCPAWDGAVLILITRRLFLDCLRYDWGGVFTGGYAATLAQLRCSNCCWREVSSPRVILSNFPERSDTWPCRALFWLISTSRSYTGDDSFDSFHVSSILALGFGSLDFFCSLPLLRRSFVFHILIVSVASGVPVFSNIPLISN